MNKYIAGVFVVVFQLLAGDLVFAQEKIQTIGDSLSYNNFIKTEINSGIWFYLNNSRESVNTAFSENTEKRANNLLYYGMDINSWKYLPELQETFGFSAGIGPIYSTGESTRETVNITTEFSDKIYGASVLGDANYSGRYYYDDKNYALAEAYGYGRFEKVNIKSEGKSYRTTGGDLLSETVIEERVNNKFRYGIDVKAGIGFGKMEPVNYLMQAEFLLEEIYPEMLFTTDQKKTVASIIAKVKNKRKLREKISSEQELKEIKNLIREKLLLQTSDFTENILEYGEFIPRLSGSRLELGPMFKYYNREPDFIYGGFVRYEINSYKNYKWNLNVLTELNYNKYKKRDWFLWETNFHVEHFKNLRTKYTFGVKYVPVLVVNEFTDIEPVQHALIPYLEYYHQINHKQRVSLAFRYKITNDNDFFIKGPEFSLGFYRSRY